MRSTIFYKSGIMCPEGDGGAGKNTGDAMNPSEAASKVTNGKRTGSALKSDTYHRSANMCQKVNWPGERPLTLQAVTVFNGPTDLIAG